VSLTRGRLVFVKEGRSKQTTHFFLHLLYTSSHKWRTSAWKENH